ncbi:unnamed protein product [Phaedon cochleariae]|uniref:Folylpolyglutamate synthase n=1 Tax=Phaedon cochleariae TaxID=80249 RepID=A0A9P0GLV2_PHACE|nr:unnamed protein product [Phaedon cochleariae]
MFLSRYSSIRLLSSVIIQSNMSSLQRNYKDAIEALNGLQTNAQYIKNAAAKPKAATNIPEVTKFLNRSGISLEHLDKLSVIHITGTNGKGTTCAYCERILRDHGYKTGFYSSPHLLDVRERIRINGKPISKKDFAQYFWRMFDLLDKHKRDPNDMPLYFRFLTILAFNIFLDQKVDVAIIEVGIGGEYDCTNVLRKTKVVGITPLDLDHTSLLGNTLESIAWNKSGIMKEGCIALSACQPESVLQVFRERSKERKCTFQVVEKDSFVENNSNFPSHIQSTNASLALALSEAYINQDNNNSKPFSLDLAKKSIEQQHWPGRYEIKRIENLSFFLDGAHTLESIRVCRDWFLSHTRKRPSKRTLIFNLTGDRDPDIFFKELASCHFQSVIFTPNVGTSNDRADIIDFILPEDKQLMRCLDYKRKWVDMEASSTDKVETVHVARTFSEAVESLKDGSERDILVTGSIHLIGAAMSVLDPTLDGALSD